MRLDMTPAAEVERRKGMEKMDYRQIQQLKEQHKDALLFVRLGDFYETFDDDAKTISKELDLTLTGRNMTGAAERVPMAGIPFHILDDYIKRLVEKGYKIAVAENMNISRLEPPEQGAQKQDAADERGDFYEKQAKEYIQRGLREIPDNNRRDYLTARLIAATVFSDFVNKEMDFMDAQYVDPVSDRLFYEKPLLKDMLSKMPGTEDSAAGARYVKEICEKFSKAISEDILEQYGWSRSDIYRGIFEKSMSGYIDQSNIEPAKGLLLKSPFLDWLNGSNETLPQEVREAAEWLIVNGYEKERDVSDAFYNRQTSCWADHISQAEASDNAAIVHTAERYRNKEAEKIETETSEAAKDNQAKDSKARDILKGEADRLYTAVSDAALSPEARPAPESAAQSTPVSTTQNNIFSEDTKMDNGNITPFTGNAAGQTAQQSAPAAKPQEPAPADYVKRADKALLDALRAGKYAQIVGKMVDFGDYSLRNQMLILEQDPNATRVENKRGWNYRRRHTVENPREIKILAPVFGKTITTDTEGNMTEKRSESSDNMENYTLNTVYDISQTVGEPTLEWINGKTVTDRYDLVEAALKKTLYDYTFSDAEINSDAVLDTRQKTVTLKQGLDKRARMKTLIQQIAAALVVGRNCSNFRSVGAKQIPNITAVETSAAAGVVMRKLGMENGRLVEPDLTKLSDADVGRFAGNLGVARSVSQKMIKGIENALSAAASQRKMEAAAANEGLSDAAVMEPSAPYAAAGAETAMVMGG